MEVELGWKMLVKVMKQWKLNFEVLRDVTH
jgi:hypothetical protein